MHTVYLSVSTYLVEWAGPREGGPSRCHFCSGLLSEHELPYLLSTTYAKSNTVNTIPGQRSLWTYSCRSSGSPLWKWRLTDPDQGSTQSRQSSSTSAQRMKIKAVYTCVICQVDVITMMHENIFKGCTLYMAMGRLLCRYGILKCHVCKAKPHKVV